MGYKEHKWFDLKRKGIKFELIVRDEDFGKIEIKKFTPQNFTSIMKDIGKRYGVNKQVPTPEEDIQEEIDWLKKEDIIE